jgi:hypothetical protein
MVMMTPETATERFEELAQTYGGEIARWPEGEREAARALLAENAAQLSLVLADAAQLDRLLDLAPAQRPDAALLGRLIAAGCGAALGLSAAAFAGIAVGVAVGRPQAAAPVVVAEQPVVTAVDTSSALQDALAEPSEL